MNKNKKRLLSIAGSLAIGGTVLLSCASDPDNLGSQFFEGNSAKEAESLYDVVAYNINNNDSIRSDAAKLDSATLGAFKEDVFGLQKAAYVTQIRPSSYAPNFGANAVVDSAVLVIKPLYDAGSAHTVTDENYVYPEGNVPAKKVVVSYPVKKYGNGDKNLTINVNTVEEFLGSSTDKVFSNKNIATGQLLGSKVFKGSVSSVKITKDADNSELFNREVGLRIPLQANYFQTNILDKSKSPELADAATFIRFIKGIKISVTENDGYIFKFTPNSVALNIYYTSDKTVDGKTERVHSVYALDAASSNAHISLFDYDRAGSLVAGALASANPTTGDAKVFAQGMGGPGIGIKIPAQAVQQIKDLYNAKKSVVVSAKIRLYRDNTTWNSTYANPTEFLVKQKGLNTFLTDMSAYVYNRNFDLVRAYNLKEQDAYYDISITEAFKQIVEKEAENRDFILNVGQYTVSSTGSYIGGAFTDSQNYNTAAYTPNRIVLVGTDPGNPKRASLRVLYVKK